jgi:hypothetical protein
MNRCRSCRRMLAVPSTGTRVATVICGEGTGASERGITCPVGRGGKVQGFLWGYYGPCVPDGALKRTRGRQAILHAMAGGLSSRASETEWTGLYVTPSGRSLDRTYLLPRSETETARFPPIPTRAGMRSLKPNGQTGNGAWRRSSLRFFLLACFPTAAAAATRRSNSPRRRSTSAPWRPVRYPHGSRGTR